ncbi:helix-turn-helix domain-containing protein [Streptomyces sp. NPDC047002]|uniref:helix-turn-helix domain-containing protein n=1 Tax=Streptomyces sp. NPDC047002 TaxID=3155475 RepID=UPI0034562A2C
MVEGAFQVLRALAHADPDHQVASVAAATGIPRASVYRLLAQLEDAGAVENRRGYWHLSTGLLQVSSEVEPLPGLRDTAAAVLQQLREHTGAMVSIVVPHGPDLVAVEMLPGRTPLPFPARSGTTLPPGTAAGEVLGAPGPATTPVVRAREGEDAERVMAGMSCFAVPVRAGGGAAALQIATAPSVPARRYAPVLRRAAAMVETALRPAGGSGPRPR